MSNMTHEHDKTYIVSWDKGAYAPDYLHRLFSNWGGGFTDLYSTLDRYIHEIDTLALRQRPHIRTKYKSAMLDASLQLLAIAKDMDLLTNCHGLCLPIFALLDNFEKIQNTLQISSDTALDPVLRTAASSVMSQTYRETLERDAAEIEKKNSVLLADAEKNIDDLGTYFIAKPEPSTDLIRVMTNFYEKSPKSFFITLFFAKIVGKSLPYIHKKGHLRAYTAIALDGALGLVSDSKEEIENDSTLRGALYHPIQAMGLAFGGKPLDILETDADIGKIDQTLPQTQDTIYYNITSLVSPDYSNRLPARAGLNYRIVAQLNTIQLNPIEEKTITGGRNGFSCANGMIARTDDHKKKYRVLCYNSLDDDSPPVTDKSLLAGPAKRLTVYNDLICAKFQEKLSEIGFPDHRHVLELYEQHNTDTAKYGMGRVIDSELIQQQFKATPPEIRSILPNLSSHLTDINLKNDLKWIKGHFLDSVQATLPGVSQIASIEAALTVFLRAITVSHSLEKIITDGATIKIEVPPSLKIFAMVSSR